MLESEVAGTVVICVGGRFVTILSAVLFCVLRFRYRGARHKITAATTDFLARAGQHSFLITQHSRRG